MTVKPLAWYGDDQCKADVFCFSYFVHPRHNAWESFVNKWDFGIEGDCECVQTISTHPTKAEAMASAEEYHQQEVMKLLED
jgi:hypothetical protein